MRQLMTVCDTGMAATPPTRAEEAIDVLNNV